MKTFKSLKSANLTPILLYLLSFIIPFALLGMLFMFYSQGFGNPVPNVMTFFLLLESGLASLCFFYFCTHSARHPVKQASIQILFSTAYGLSSYILLQEQSHNIIFIYILFPILFLYFENIQSGKNYVHFILLSAAILLLDPQTSLPILLLLSVLYIIELFIYNNLNLGNIIHFLACILLSAIISAIRLFPHISAICSEGSTYNGFQFNYPLSVFLSRTLPFNTASSAFFSTNGMDLYFGLFFMFLSILFFFNVKISRRTRLAYGLFSLLILSSIEISPIQYALNLFHDFSSSTVSYDFIFIFWSLQLGLLVLPNLKTLHIGSFSGSVAVLLILECVALFWGGHNFHTVSIYSIILFQVLIIALCLAILLSKNKSSIFSKALYIIVLLEFFCNAFISTNQDFIPKTRSLQGNFVFSDNGTENENTAPVPSSPISSEEYEQFIQENTDYDMYFLTNTLSDSLSLSEDEYEIYGQKPLLNNFEYMNALCHKLGYDEDLFLSVQDIQIHFAENDNYIITPISNGIYNIEFRSLSSYSDPCYIPFTLSSSKEITQNIYFYNDHTENLLCLTPETINNRQTCYLSVYPQEYFTINLQTLTYAINPNVADTLKETLHLYSKKNILHSSFIGFSDYWGIIISCIGLLLLLLLFFNKDREKIYSKLLYLKSKLSAWELPKRFVKHISNNYVYYLAFTIPFMLFIATMIIFDCVPFGQNSFYDEDGLCLTLPSTIDTYYNLKEGNTYLSMYGGYGYNLYALNPLVQCSRFLTLLNPSQIAPFLLFMEAVCLGLCGLNTTLYLTHRLNGKRAHKKDYRLLIPALIYSLNTYMLAMHGFTGWYYTLMAFPLLVLCLDYLIYRKKTLPYVCALAFCMITNLYLALYICIFLFIHFFTYNFSSVKDFLKKGITFGLSSILSALNSFFIISNTLLSTYDSPYQEQDALFPGFGFHTSFLNQWKNHMIFSSSSAVTADNGYVSLYCSILALLLVIVFLTSNKLKLKDKLKRIIPIIILYLSFNGNVLSYIWNGFHYQSKVPNRYAFLLMFLLAISAYDGICLLKHLRLKGLLSIFLGCICTITIFQFFSDGNSTLAYVSTIVLLILYLFIFIISRSAKCRSISKKILVGLFVTEVACNMIFTTGNYALNSILLFGNYEKEAEFIQNKLNAKEEYFRISFPSSSLYNGGQMYHVGSNSLFNSFVSLHQVNTNYLFGFFYGTNNINSNYSGTPFSTSISSVRYVYIPVYANMPIKDMNQYKYIGKSDLFYVFENPNALSLGFYAPSDIENLLPQISFPPNFYNDFVSLYLDQESLPLFDTYYIECEDTPVLGSDYIYFTDINNNLLRFDEANSIYENVREEANASPISALRIHLNITPAKSGEAYLYSNEFISLGELEKDVPIEIETPYPNPISEFRNAYNYVILNKDTLNDFYDAASKNQLENIRIGNNTITGTTNYSEDGYTLLSLAYDRNWHAYLDDKEVEIQDYFNSFMLIETPAGQHTLELKYIPYGMKASKLITYLCWFCTFIGYTAFYIRSRKK